jgi:hypothetical protein
MSNAREVAQRMTEGALGFLDALDDGQRAKLSFALDDTEERTNWAYFPRTQSVGLRKGLRDHDARKRAQPAGGTARGFGA